MSHLQLIYLSTNAWLVVSTPLKNMKVRLVRLDHHPNENGENKIHVQIPFTVDLLYLLNMVIVHN